MKRSRRSLFSALLGVSTGALLTGLIVPFAVGERTDGTPTAIGPVAGSAPTVQGDPTTPATVPTPSENGPAGQPTGVDTQPAHTGEAVGPSASPARSAGGTLRIGALLLEVGGLQQIGHQVGVPPVEEQRRVVRAFLDELNERGGVHGRTLEAVYAKVDPLRTDSERAACLALVDDGDVFAVIGTMITEAGILCITREHGVPAVLPSLVALDSTFRESRGLLFTNQSRAGRAVANLARRLEARRLLEDATAGILTSETTDPGSRLAEDLAGHLKRLGHPVPVISTLSSDLSVAASQMPVEVRRMQSAGVDHVMLLTAGLLSAQFVRQAESQRWFPAWAASDVGPMYTDAAVQNMPRSFHGAHLVTTTRAADTKAGIPEQPDARSCRAGYEERTGIRYERGSNAYGLALSFCTAIASVVAGVVGAGPELDAARWSAALQGAGSFARISPNWGGGAFGPGKFDMADLIRTNRFDASCTCWRPTEPFGNQHV